jgi:hypothetical protein
MFLPITNSDVLPQTTYLETRLGGPHSDTCRREGGRVESSFDAAAPVLDCGLLARATGLRARIFQDQTR